MRELAPLPDLPLHFRKMQLDDMDAVMDLQRDAFRHPWSVELFRRELEHDWSTVLLAEVASPEGTLRLAGFLIFWLVHDELHILNLATALSWRRRGVAKQLLRWGLERARLHRCVLATLEVRRSNESAQGLYRSFGFTPVGVRASYYVEDREDAVVMVLELPLDTMGSDR